MPQDYAETLKWCRKAADQGQPSPQAALGSMYEDGKGVPQDYVQAHMWFNLAPSHERMSGAVEERWSQFLRQRAKVDSPTQRMNHYEDAETVFG